MRKISANVVFPVSSPPIKNGVVIVDANGKILSIDHQHNFKKSTLEIYDGILCPGFINAHCHLELSYMENKIPQRKGLPEFIINLIEYRKAFSLTNETENLIYEKIENAEKEMWENGIVAVGDISNDAYSFKVKSKSLMRTHTFIECFGFYPDQAEVYFKKSLELLNQAQQQNLTASITPHAPYSVPPELFKLIFSYNGNQSSLYSYHNQESEAENIFFKNGIGEFVKVFDHFNLPLSLFDPTGKNSLQSVIDYFPQNKKTLFVHNIFSNAGDIAAIASQCPESYFCLCPRANKYIENALPDFSHFRSFTNRICIGTDSLASNDQLSVLEEMKTIQAADHSISTEELLRWATLNGARFFDWHDQLGALEIGKAPGLNLITGISPLFHLTSQSAVKKIV